MNQVIDICRFFYLQGFKKILILNGHVPNGWILRAAMDSLRATYEDIHVKVLSWFETSNWVRNEFVKDGGDHAGYSETSIMMALRPELVRRTKMADEPARDVIFDYRYDQRSISGVWGKPSMASAEAGEKILQRVVEDLAKWVKAAMKAETPIKEKSRKSIYK